MLNRWFAQIPGGYSSKHDQFHCWAEKNRQGEALVSPCSMWLCCKPGGRRRTDHPLQQPPLSRSLPRKLGGQQKHELFVLFLPTHSQPKHKSTTKRKSIGKKKDLFIRLEKFRFSCTNISDWGTKELKNQALDDALCSTKFTFFRQWLKF